MDWDDGIASIYWFHLRLKAVKELLLLLLQQ